MTASWWKRHADEGSATAEFAVVLPSVAAVAILVLCLGRAVVVSMDCQDAAAVAAHAMTITGHDGESRARAAASAAAGNDARVSFSRTVDSVTVTVQCPVIPDPTGVLPTRVTGKATRYF
jgi:Flp pilus assembly protein TadG